jgi:hypothetical protein
VPTRAFGRTLERLGFRIGLEVLHFLRRLPEEEIWADRGPEDGDDHRQSFGGERRARPDDGYQGLAPWHGHREHHRDVREQGEREPLEIAHVFLVGHVDLQ